jgi:antitoxin StbD
MDGHGPQCPSLSIACGHSEKYVSYGKYKKEASVSNTASSSEVQKNFGAYHDQALSEPVRVTKYGRETVYIVSAKTYHELKQAQREAIASADLTDTELALIEAAEIPAKHRYTLGE